MKKYLNYLIFGIVVLGVVGLAVNHSRNMRQMVRDMANGSPDAQKAAAERLIKAEQFMDAVTGEPQPTRIQVVAALEAPARLTPSSKPLPISKTRSVLSVTGWSPPSRKSAHPHLTTSRNSWMD